MYFTMPGEKSKRGNFELIRKKLFFHFFRNKSRIETSNKWMAMSGKSGERVLLLNLEAVREIFLI